MTLRIAIMWRGDLSAEAAGFASNERLRPVAEAFVAAGARVEPVIWRDEVVDAIRPRLLTADAVLVWVDPIGGGEDRSRVDPLLREVAEAGVMVSAHPDVITAIGTKDVLFDTRQIGWAGDVHRYASLDELRAALPARLTTGARVLKERRGNGGIGVWKVELVDVAGGCVRVHEAHVRDLATQELGLDEFVDQFAPYFESGGCLVDQPFQPRVAEGMTRAYLVGDEVVGFAYQGAETLVQSPADVERVMGLPSPKTMLPPDEPRLAGLRTRLETEWLPALQRITALETNDLPLLWDLDFLLGPRDSGGNDTHVLCEINVSCITPFPPGAVARLVDKTLARLGT
jgi:hypothetical protein